MARFRPFYITLPLSIAFACAGGAMYVRAQQMGSARSMPVSETAELGPKHPVTLEMLAEAAKLTRKRAPAFEVKDSTGKSIQISGEKLQKPQFLLFILDGCPCSIDAQPIFNDFAKHFEGKVDFIGVMDGKTPVAQKWVKDYRVSFPVASDPEKKVIKGYEAINSAYSALIDQNGRIVKLWPGYSISMLEEMNKEISGVLGEEVRFFDAKYAPKEKSSGCAF